MKAIEQAWENLRLEKKLDIFPVQVTAVVVTKRHHTRLYPINEKNPGKNCPPGTVVDSGITHPYYFDFYLQSHNLRTSTAKPSHYIVLQNNMNLSPKDLQDLTYHLCYTYGRSTNAVSYAPHAYYADRLCERGRLYLRKFYDAGPQLKNDLKYDQFAEKKVAEACIMKKAQEAFYLNQTGPGIKSPWHPNLDGKMFWM